MTKAEVAKKVEETELRSRKILATYTPREAKIRLDAKLVLGLCKLAKVGLNSREGMTK